MPIPKYDEMYLAFLECLADGQPHKSKEVKDAVAGVFSISEKERAEMLPSGKQQLFDNRIGWTRCFQRIVHYDGQVHERSTPICREATHHKGCAC